MNNNQISQNAISHKELNDFLIRAQKDISLNNSSENNNIKEVQEFNNLVENWTDISQRLLLMFNNKANIFSENRNPKSLMAYGAMAAHINMALQALKSTGSDL